MGLTRRDYKVVGLVQLQHLPHGFDILRGVSPIALGFEIAEEELFFNPGFDAGDGTGDFPGHERLAAAGRLVVEKNPVTGKEAVGFPVINRHPVGENLGRRISAAGVKGREFGLWYFLCLAEHLGARGLVELAGDAGFAQGLQDAHGPDGGDVGGVFGDIEANADVALRAEMIDLVGLQTVEELDQVRGIAQVAVVKEKTYAGEMGVAEEMVDARGVERARPPDDSVDFVAFGEEQFGEVRAVLAGDAGDEGFFHGSLVLLD